MNLNTFLRGLFLNLIENGFQREEYMRLIKSVVAIFEKKLNRFPLFFKIYSWPYKFILKKEIKLGQITEKDRVLNIGCGAMPFTAVYIARLTGAEVTAIDIDNNACQQARKCIDNLGLTDKIKIKKEDGVKYDPVGYTKIIIALQADPKKEIMENIYTNSDPLTHIIFRKARDFFQSQYDTIPDNYKYHKAVKQKMITFNKSVLFVKGVSK